MKNAISFLFMKPIANKDRWGDFGTNMKKREKGINQ
ncbi:MAG: hypothetical protein ACI8RA_002333 [Chlamydiales bacterium]|jgi:hypothetical protein